MEGEYLVGDVRHVPGGENDLEYENLARFAVDEHNKKEHKSLRLKKIVNVKQQVVAGMIYFITLEAFDGDEIKLFEAKVWVQLWENLKSLEEFKALSTPVGSVSV